MIALQQYLISARFMTTLCHLVSLLLLFPTVKNNIETSLSDTADHEDRLRAQQTAWVCLFLPLSFISLFLLSSFLFLLSPSYPPTYLFFYPHYIPASTLISPRFPAIRSPR
jgi:hypothetical protein